MAAGKPHSNAIALSLDGHARKALDPDSPGWSEGPSRDETHMRLPFFYGWVVVAVTFVTMAIGVNARTAFSLFFPPIISEFGWERGVTAGAFSFGFVVSGMVSPLIGRLMDRAGPRAVME